MKRRCVYGEKNNGNTPTPLHAIIINKIKCQPIIKLIRRMPFNPNRAVVWKKTFSKATCHTHTPPLSLLYSPTMIIVPYNAQLQTWSGCECGPFSHSACWEYISHSSPRHRLQGLSMWDMPLGLSLSFFFIAWTLSCHWCNATLASCLVVTFLDVGLWRVQRWIQCPTCCLFHIRPSNAWAFLELNILLWLLLPVAQT